MANNKSELATTDFDTRMVEWNLKHNLVTREQLKAHLSSLPDESANAEQLQIEDGDTGGMSNG